MKVCVFTLGCKTNYYESQQIAWQLTNQGHKVVTKFDDCDLVIINSCAVTKEAEKKSRQAIARARAKSPNAKVIVVGCASQKDQSQFDCNLTVGNADKTDVLDYIDKEGSVIEQLPTRYKKDCPALQSRTRAYVKVQEGCNNFCSYCIVPYLRGRSRSKLVKDVVEEIKGINAEEIVITGIDVSQYGKDTNESLEQLFGEIAKVTSARIRLGSLEPRAITPQLLENLSKLNFCPHFHLSMQSGCDSTLARMNRHYTTKEYFESVQLIRQFFPLSAITTDVIVGFSGETEEEFAQTVKFVEKCQFQDIHVFPFSKREGTVAYNWQDVDASAKKRRVATLLSVKQKLKNDHLTNQIGTVAQVLLEQRKDGFLEGYTPQYVKVYTLGGTLGKTVSVKIEGLYKDGVKGTEV